MDWIWGRMSTFTKDIADILSDNGFGVIGDDIFTGEDVPPKPDNMIIVKNAGTLQPDFPSIDLSSPFVQIIVRAGKGGSQLSEETAYRIKTFMKRIAGYEINDSVYVYINHMSGPVDIGIDEIMRPSYSTNYLSLRTSTRGELRVRARQSSELIVSMTYPIVFNLAVNASQKTYTKAKLISRIEQVRLYADIRQRSYARATISTPVRVLLRLACGQVTFSRLSISSTEGFLSISVAQLTSTTINL